MANLVKIEKISLKNHPQINLSCNTLKNLSCEALRSSHLSAWLSWICALLRLHPPQNRTSLLLAFPYRFSAVWLGITVLVLLFLYRARVRVLALFIPVSWLVPVLTLSLSSQ